MPLRSIILSFIQKSANKICFINPRVLIVWQAVSVTMYFDTQFYPDRAVEYDIYPERNINIYVEKQCQEKFTVKFVNLNLCAFQKWRVNGKNPEKLNITNLAVITSVDNGGSLVRQLPAARLDLRIWKINHHLIKY